jgi:hypothetical protein
MVPFVSVVRESLLHCSAGAGPDDVLSAGAQALPAARPMTASTDTRQKTLRMGGIIAHRTIRRQHSDHDDQTCISLRQR